MRNKTIMVELRQTFSLRPDDIIDASPETPTMSGPSRAPGRRSEHARWARSCMQLVSIVSVTLSVWPRILSCVFADPLLG